MSCHIYQGIKHRDPQEGRRQKVSDMFLDDLSLLPGSSAGNRQHEQAGCNPAHKGQGGRIYKLIEPSGHYEIPGPDHGRTQGKSKADPLYGPAGT